MQITSERRGSSPCQIAIERGGQHVLLQPTMHTRAAAARSGTASLATTAGRVEIAAVPLLAAGDAVARGTARGGRDKDDLAKEGGSDESH